MASEAELRSVRGRLLGLIDERRILRVDVDRPGPDAIAGFLALGDLCSTVSDALDELGVGGGVAASRLQPRVPGARVVGPAITIRYAPEGANVGAIRARGERARLADRDLYAVGQAGDVAVFDVHGFEGASIMGGLSARWARRLGIAGCVVDGAVRDVEAIRRAELPVWARAVTPVSGKHRLAAVEINGEVSLAGLPVSQATSSSRTRRASASFRAPTSRRRSRSASRARRRSARSSRLSRAGSSRRRS